MDNRGLHKVQTFNWIALALTCVALALRLYRIDGQEFWLDESLTAHLVQADDWLYLVHNTPPLYYAALRGWVHPFGLDEFSLRSFSAVCGALFVGTITLCARDMFGVRAGVITGMLALISPLHIYYSQEARAYSLLLLSLVLVFWMLWKLDSEYQKRVWVYLLLFTTAAMYTHYLALIVLGLAYLFLILFGTRSTARYLIRAGMLSALFFSCWLLWWWNNTHFYLRDMDWLDRVWEGLPGVTGVTASLYAFSFSLDAGVAPVFLKQFTTMEVPYALRTVGVLSILCLGVIGVVSMRKESAATRKNVAYVLLLLVGPLLALLVISSFKPIYFPARYDLIAFPAFLLFLGYLVSRATRSNRFYAGVPGCALALVVCLVMLHKDWLYFDSADGVGYYAPRAAHILMNVDNEDLVLLIGTTGLPVLAQLYVRGYRRSGHVCSNTQENRSFVCRHFPVSLENAPAATTRVNRVSNPESITGDLLDIVQGYSRDDIWLVLPRDAKASSTQLSLDMNSFHTVSALGTQRFVTSVIYPAMGILKLTRTDEKEQM